MFFRKVCSTVEICFPLSFSGSSHSLSYRDIAFFVFLSIESISSVSIDWSNTSQNLSKNQPLKDLYPVT